MSDSQSTEEFRPLPGHPGYEVSSRGRVRSLLWREPRVLKPCRCGDGYLGLILRGGRRGYIHHLVLEAFVGPCPAGLQTRHLNGIRTDNRLENLQWGTRAENAADKKIHGTSGEGERNPTAKITTADLMEMRRLRETGASRSEIADRFNLSETHVSKVLLGALWSHVAPSPEERHRLRAKGVLRGERHHLAKLTAETVRRIRVMAREGLSGAAIARALGVNKSTVCRVIRGDTWAVT